MPFFIGLSIPGDLALSADGRTLVFTTSEAERVKQSITMRAQIFKGSWRYDLNLGVPYLQEILVAGAKTELVRRRFYELLKETPGVTSVLFLDVVLDRPSGEVRVTFEVSIGTGTVADTLLVGV